MSRHDVTEVGWGMFVIEPVSGRDFVLVRHFGVTWKYQGRARHMVALPGWRFGPGVSSTPGIWRGFVNPIHMLRSSCAHDLNYATQGGRRPEKTIHGTEIVLPYNDMTRAEADALAYAMAIKDGINPTQATVVWAVLRACGKGVWDE